MLTLASDAICLDVILSPMAMIASGLGPMKDTGLLVVVLVREEIRLENAAFSERNPYPVDGMNV